MIKSKFAFAHIRVATEYAKLSSCERLKVGCLLVKGDTPIAIGYNGTKTGTDNCCEENGKTKPGVRHAEINALNKLWTTNEKAAGAIAFITHAPCLDCAQDMVNAGITAVYFRWHYKEGNETGVMHLLEKGIEVYKVLPDIDTINRASIEYQCNRDYEVTGIKLAYAKVNEVNEEAARAAEPVERDYFEAREERAASREVLAALEDWGFFPFETHNKSLDTGTPDHGVRSIHAGGR